MKKYSLAVKYIREKMLQKNKSEESDKIAKEESK